ncbi:hypothetical protein CSW46_06340, partial [Thermus scotoductus]|uniref:hypothetical protein n=1 Tax=Thermus scotoductus TaxID=37636 RepID=UPI00100487B4
GLAHLPVYRYSKEGKDDLGPLLKGEPGVVVGTTAFLRGPVLPVYTLLAQGRQVGHGGKGQG